MRIAFLLMLAAVGCSCKAAPPEGPGPAPHGEDAIALALRQFGGRDFAVDLTLRRNGGPWAIMGVTYLSRRGTTDADLAPLRSLVGLDAIELVGAAPLSDRPSGLSASAVRSLARLKLRRISLGGTVNPECVREIGRLVQLEDLHFFSGSIGDKGLASLGELQKLRHLDLWNMGLTDTSMAYISQLKGLEELDVSHNDITDRALAHVAVLTNLRQLALDDLGPAGLSALRNLPRLERLSVVRLQLPTANADLSVLKALKLLHARWSDDGGAVVRLPKSLQRIEITEGIAPRLDLQSLKNVEDVSLLLGPPRACWTLVPELQWLATCSHLRELTLRDASDRLAHVVARLPSLRALTIEARCQQFGDEGMRPISKLRELTSLTVRYSDLTDTGMMALQSLPKLRRLELLVAPKVTAAGLDHIWGLRQLRSLNLDISAETLEGSEDHVVAAMAALTQLEELSLRGHLTDNALKSLAALKKLHRLDLTGTEGYTDTALASLVGVLPALAELRFTIGTWAGAH
jgi:Leucine-rich repeat (LRR) protein